MKERNKGYRQIYHNRHFRIFGRQSILVQATHIGYNELRKIKQAFQNGEKTNRRLTVQGKDEPKTNPKEHKN